MDRAMIERWGAQAKRDKADPVRAYDLGREHHLLSRIVELAAEARALDIVAEAARALDDALDTMAGEIIGGARLSDATLALLDRRRAELRRALGDRYL